MKTIVRILSLALIFSFVAVACNKDNAVTTTGISSDEAADEVGATLSTDVSNSATDLSPLAKRASGARASESGRIEGCGVAYDTTINRSFTGTYVSYNYSVTYMYNLTCTNGGVPSSLSYSLSNTGSRSGVRLNSEGSSTGSLSATGFEVSKSAYTVNGSINRAHTVVQKSGAQKTFTGQSQSALTDLVVDKSTKKILSGSASITASGNSSTGGSYNYSASVVFNGDGTADYTINSTVYIVNLATGQVSKK